MDYVYEMPKGVCSKEVSFTIENGCVKNVQFKGGCQGNLAAIAKLIEGKGVKYVVRVLKGNKCGNRPTSCADCFARFLEEAYNESVRRTTEGV